VLVEEMQRMAKRIQDLEALLERQAARSVEMLEHIDNFDGEEHMTKEAIKPVLDIEGPLHVVCQCDKCKAEKQEPVAWLCQKANGHFDVLTDQACKKCFPVYTTPQQRTWVGLTENERHDLYEKYHNQYDLPNQGDPDGFDYERAIEAELNEKNT
jgi:hypothetical protein